MQLVSGREQNWMHGDTVSSECLCLSQVSASPPFCGYWAFAACFAQLFITVWL